MLKVIVTGVTGLIGQVLSMSLTEAGYDVVGLSRNPEAHPGLKDAGVRLVPWNGSDPEAWYPEAEGAFAIINLAGENIAGGRWTSARKQHILQSRLDAIHHIQNSITLVSDRPKLLIQASATGYYGHNPGIILNEHNPAGSGFLADVCKAIESKAKQTQGIEVVSVRTGIVLSTRGGALPKLTASMRLGVGGYPGKGQQMVPWIHIQDMVRAILHIVALKKEHRVSVYNLTAPVSVTMKTLVKQAARRKHALISLPVPIELMKLMLGAEMVRETLLADQAVQPSELLHSGFRFLYPDIQQALDHLLV